MRSLYLVLVLLSPFVHGCLNEDGFTEIQDLKSCYNDNTSQLNNLWPAHCAEVHIERPPGCVKFDKAVDVGIKVRFGSSEAVTKNISIAYLGVLEHQEYDGDFLYGKTLVADEFVFDSATEQYLSAPIWGLPSIGTHVFRTPQDEHWISVTTTDTIIGCTQELNIALSDTGRGRVAVNSPITNVIVRDPEYFRISSSLAQEFPEDSFVELSYIYVDGEDYSADATGVSWTFLEFPKELTIVPIPDGPSVNVGVVIGNKYCKNTFKSSELIQSPIIIDIYDVEEPFVGTITIESLGYWSTCTELLRD